VKKCGVWKKDLGVSREIILTMALSGLLDLLFLVLLLLVIASLYRTVPLLSDMCAANAFSLTRKTTRDIVQRHVRGIGADILLVTSTMASMLVVLVTLFAIPGFLEDLPNQRSLEEVRTSCWTHLAKICRYLGELLTLFTFFRTYKLLVRSLLFVVLVPAACLSDLLTVPGLCDTNQFFCFSGGISLWGGLVVCGVLTVQYGTPWAVPSHELNVAHVLCALLFLLLLGTVVALGKSEKTTLARADWARATPRLTWSNIFAFLSVPLDSAFLCFAMLYCLVPDDSLQTFVDEQVVSAFSFEYASLDGNAAAAVTAQTALALIAFWALLVSFPLAAADNEEFDDYRESLQGGVMYRAFKHFIGQFLYLPIMFSVFQPLSCAPFDGDEATCEEMGEGWWHRTMATLATMGCLYFTTTAHVLHAHSEIHEHGNDLGLDVLYTPVFVMAVKCCQLLTLGACLFTGSDSGVPSSTMLLLAVVTTACSVVVETAGAAVGVCAIRFMAPLRLSCAMVTLGTAVTGWAAAEGIFSLSPSHYAMGVGGVLGLGLVATGVISRLSGSERYKQLVEQGLVAVIEELESVEGRLVVEEAAEGEWNSREAVWKRRLKEVQTPGQAARLLLEFEDAILLQRLSLEFLDKRQSWRDLLCSRDLSLDFKAVCDQAKNLKAGIRTRTSFAMVKKVLDVVVKRHRLSPYTHRWIMPYLFSYQNARDAIRPALIGYETCGGRKQGASITKHIDATRVSLEGIRNMSGLDRAGPKEGLFVRVLLDNGFKPLEGVVRTVVGELDLSLVERQARDMCSNSPFLVRGLAIKEAVATHWLPARRIKLYRPDGVPPQDNAVGGGGGGSLQVTPRARLGNYETVALHQGGKEDAQLFYGRQLTEDEAAEDAVQERKTNPRASSLTFYKSSAPSTTGFCWM